MKFKDAGIHIRKNMFPNGTADICPNGKNAGIRISDSIKENLPDDTEKKEYAQLDILANIVIDFAMKGIAKRRTGPHGIFCVWENGHIKAALTRRDILENWNWRMGVLSGDTPMVIGQTVDMLQIENVAVFEEKEGAFFIVGNTKEELFEWMGSQLNGDTAFPCG